MKTKTILFLVAGSAAAFTLYEVIKNRKDLKSMPTGAKQTATVSAIIAIMAVLYVPIFAVK